jgi:hypothetical protein
MKTFLSVCVILLMWVSSAMAAAIGDAVEISIITDNGRALQFYPAKIRHDLKKVYAEAGRGEHYRIVVRNKLNRRVGVVVAVDGRNIISGQKSWLKNTERMYIIEANSTNEYSGWRTSQDKINRFYFTDVPDSYAAAFGDETAMGVIAVAAYPEIQRYILPKDCSRLNLEKKKEDSGDRAAAPSVAGKAQALESAGTGYGREEYSPSYSVKFDPENRAVESILVKYEWRKTLCKMNIINCGRTYEQSDNRIWGSDGYAPPPPWRR